MKNDCGVILCVKRQKRQPLYFTTENKKRQPLINQKQQPLYFTKENKTTTTDKPKNNGRQGKQHQDTNKSFAQVGGGWIPGASRPPIKIATEAKNRYTFKQLFIVFQVSSYSFGTLSNSFLYCFLSKVVIYSTYCADRPYRRSSCRARGTVPPGVTSVTVFGDTLGILIA